MPLHTKFRSAFLWLLAFYGVVVFILASQGENKLEHLHLVLDTSNGLLSLSLALFLLAEQSAISERVRQYLALAFAFAAFTEILHALVGIEWDGSFAWIQNLSLTIRPATWPPSTYILPIALAWVLWLKRNKSNQAISIFAFGMTLLTIVLMTLFWLLPKYVDTGILNIHRPTQLPLLLLWAWVIVGCWRIRDEHPLYEGLALMGVVLILSDAFMLFSTSPHEKFTMMAHSGKLFAYLLLHFIQMRVASEDSHARKAAELALAVKATQLEAAYEESTNLRFAMDQHSIIAVTDAQGTITYANQIFSDTSGYSSTELLGQNHRILNSGKHPTEFFREMYQTIAAGKVWHGDICNRAKSGNLYWVQTTIVPIMNKQHKPLQYISMRTEITERKNAEEKLLGMALYDNLTKLPNRRLLYERIEAAKEASQRSGRYGALLFLDLDHFKPLNDTYGHNVGDLLLAEVAARIKKSVRAVDTAARIGGDEFVVLLSELSSTEAESSKQASDLADKVRLALAEPYVMEYKQDNGSPKIVTHHCSSCIGVALFKAKELAADDIVQMADLAMYQAKEAGPNSMKLYQGFE